MAVELTIVEVNDGFVIDAKRVFSIKSASQWALAAGVGVGSAAYFFIPQTIPLACLVGGLVALLTFLERTREERSRLRVNRYEFALRSNVRNGFRPKRTVATADIRWLEYREDASNEDSSHPSGLNAETRRDAV
jgi:hypothetical protein